MALGVASFGSNISSGNYGAAALDGLGVVYDGIATAVPVLPGFAGASLKAKRAAKALENAAEKAGDAADGADAAAERAKNIANGIPASALGPSGKPKIHVKRHPTRKRAQEAAQDRSRSGGTPEQHNNPTRGEDPH